MINKENAKDFDFEIELLKVVEDRLTQKISINSEMRSGALTTTAMNKLNTATRLIEELATVS